MFSSEFVSETTSIEFTLTGWHTLVERKLKHALGDITQQTLEDPIHILESHAVVSCPTRKSVDLTRQLSLDVQTYLITHCTFTPPQVVEVINDSLELQD